MAKRFGRRTYFGGVMEYCDTVEELLAAQKIENARIRDFYFGVIGLMAGGLLAYVLMQWMHIDSKIVRFVSVVVGIWLGRILGASLSVLWWTILKWTLSVTAIILIGVFIWLII